MARSRIDLIPVAAIAGSARELPLGWQHIDASAGVIGTVPLLEDSFADW